MACPSEHAIVDYVEHALDERARARIDAHLDRCPRCQTAAIELASALGEPMRSRDEVYGGRYRVEEMLGAGAMGVVYAAHDTELDRPVALKVLRRRRVDADPGTTAPLSVVSPQAASDAVARARREARALARLHHPNVVAVYDVGPCSEGLFIAMELVEGVTLRRWLAETARSFKEIVRVFVGAADALAAAHACGLVHRDFKPDNVIVRDGQAKVLDFGLARGFEVEAETLVGPLPDEALDHRVTRTGMVLGTPRYMAPELHEGASADARSDQYAFFVALHEALGRRRPFEARSMAELHDEKRRGPSLTGPGYDDVPRWLRAVVRRGMCPDPAGRFASMDAVVRRLRRGSARNVGWPVAAALGAIGVVGAWLGMASSTSVGCAEPARSLDDVWTTSRRNAVARALASGPRPVEPAVASLDAWTRGFEDAYAEACDAQSDEARDATLGCLAESRVALEELLTRVEAGKASEIHTSKLPDPAACAEVAVDRGGESEPRFQQLRETVARGLFLADEPAPAEALEILLPAVEQARARGATWLQARALMAAGVAYGHADDVPATRRMLLEAYEVARSHGHDRIEAAVATRLANVYASDDKDAERSLQWTRHAEAALRRLGREPETDHKLQIALGKAHQIAGDLDAAADSFGRAVDSARSPTALATAQLNLSMIWFFQSRFDEAAELQREAVEGFRLEAGDAAPRTLGAKLSLAATLIEADRLDEGINVLDAIVATIDAAPDPFPMLEARARQAQGVVFSKQSRWPEAVEAFEASLRIAEQVYGEGHIATTPDMLNLGRVYLMHDDCAAAERVLARARTITASQPTDPARGARLDGLVDQARKCNSTGPTKGQVP